MEDGGIGVDDSAATIALRWWVQRCVRQRGEGGLVPVLVGRKNRRLGIGLNLYNVSSLLLVVAGTRRRRRRTNEGEREKKEEKEESGRGSHWKDERDDGGSAQLCPQNKQMTNIKRKEGEEGGG